MINGFDEQSMVMDAADGSYYKGTAKFYAKGNRVSVEQIDEDAYRFTWIGPSWNDICDIEMERYDDDW